MTKQPPSRRALEPAQWAAIITVAVVVLLLVSRLSGRSAVLSQMGGNAVALRAAMAATPGGSAQVSDNPPTAVDAPTGGLRARALAHRAAASGRPSEAEAWLLAGMSDPTSGSLTQFQLCRLYWDLRLPDQALRACQGTVVSANYWLGAGLRALEEGRSAEALALFELSAYTDPNLAEAWRRYGAALQAADRSEEAVVALERVLYLTSSPTADVYGALAQAYLSLNNLTMARDVLDRGLLNYPEERDYYRAMAETFLADGDTKTADSWYVRMLQRWPYDAQVWAARGALAQSDNRLADAADFYREAASNSPDGFGYWMNLASVAASAENANLVREATTKALDLHPDDPAAWLTAGRYLTATGLTDDARFAFERVLALQPDNLEAAAELADMANTDVP